MHPDAALVMQGFAAFAAGDMATMKGLFSDNATWHTPGNNQFSGDYQGPDAIVRNMESVTAEATIVNEPHDILASDSHVVVLVKSTATRGNATLQTNNTMIFHVGDGKVDEVWMMSSDQAATDAFWGN